MCCCDCILVLLALLFPPLPVWIKCGFCSAESFINIALSILGYLPGVIHSFYIIAKYPIRYVVLDDEEAQVYRVINRNGHNHTHPRNHTHSHTHNQRQPNNVLVRERVSTPTAEQLVTNPGVMPYYGSTSNDQPPAYVERAEEVSSKATTSNN